MQSETAVQSTKVKAEDVQKFISLLGTDSDRKIGDLFGVSGGYVSYFRNKLKIPPHSIPKWSKPTEIRLGLADSPAFREDLSTMSNTAIAAKYNLSSSTIPSIRKRLDIYKTGDPGRYLSGRDEAWLQELYAKLGTASDAKVAAQFNLDSSTVSALRKDRQILPFKRKSLVELAANKELISKLGFVSDPVLAKQYATSRWAIRTLRKEREIPVFSRERAKVREDIIKAHDRELAAGAAWWKAASDREKDAVFARISQMWRDCQREDRQVGAIVARMAMIGFVTCDLSIERVV
mgnify:CR=1 FL=1